MYIYYHGKNNKLERENFTRIEDIQRAMSLSDDRKRISLSDLVHGEERQALRFGGEDD